MPNRMNLRGVGDLRARVCVEDDEVSELARSERATIIQFQCCGGPGGGDGNRLHWGEAGINHQREFEMLRDAWNAQAHPGVGAERDLNAGIMERLQVLLVGGDR